MFVCILKFKKFGAFFLEEPWLDKENDLGYKREILYTSNLLNI